MDDANESQISVLDEYMLMEVFSWLEFPQLAMVALVCKTWYQTTKAQLLRSRIEQHAGTFEEKYNLRLADVSVVGRWQRYILFAVGRVVNIYERNTSVPEGFSALTYIVVESDVKSLYWWKDLLLVGGAAGEITVCTAKKVKQPRLPSELLPGAPLPPKCEFAFEQQPLHSGQKSQMIKAILAWPNFEDGLDYLVGGGYVPVDNLMFWRPDSAGNYSEVTKVYSAPRKSSILCMELLDNRLYLGCEGFVAIWTREGGYVKYLSMSGLAEVRSLVFSKDREFLYGGQEHGKICCWNRQDELVRTWQAHSACINKLVLWGFTRLCSTGQDGLIKVWSTGGGTEELLQRLVLDRGGNPYWVAASKNFVMAVVGGFIVVAGRETPVQVFAPSTMLDHIS